jgi:DMSO reductase anchor subunit
MARVGLMLLAMAAVAISLFVPTVQIGLMSLPVFLIVFGEEAIGRWIFYASRLLDMNNGNRTSIYQV